MEPQPGVPGCKELESVPQLSLVPVNSVHIRSRDCKLSLAHLAEFQVLRLRTTDELRCATTILQPRWRWDLVAVHVNRSTNAAS